MKEKRDSHAGAHTGRHPRVVCALLQKTPLFKVHSAETLRMSEAKANFRKARSVLNLFILSPRENVVDENLNDSAQSPRAFCIASRVSAPSRVYLLSSRTPLPLFEGVLLVKALFSEREHRCPEVRRSFPDEHRSVD